MDRVREGSQNPQDGRASPARRELTVDGSSKRIAHAR
jgi:hypothetical protein